jgi:hypothetical protein
MASFSLSFNMDNAAFADGNHPDEVARILRDIAARVGEQGDEYGIIYDYNGNVVGNWDMTTPETEEPRTNFRVFEVKHNEVSPNDPHAAQLDPGWYFQREHNADGGECSGPFVSETAAHAAAETEE